MGLIWKSLPSECDVFCKCVWTRLDVGASAAATSWFVPFCLLHISTCLLPCSPAPLCLVPSRLNLNQPPPYPPPLPGMASILMSAVGLGVHFTSAPLPQQQQQHPPPQHQQPAPFSLPPPPPLLPPASRPIKPHSSSSTSTSSSVRRAKRQHRRGSYHTISPQIYLFFLFLFFPLINIIVVLWSAFHPQAPHAWGTLNPALTHFHASVLTICVGFDSTITGFSAVSPSSVIQALQLLHLISFNFLLKSALSWLNAAKRCSLAECFNSKYKCIDMGDKLQEEKPE